MSTTTITTVFALGVDGLHNGATPAEVVDELITQLTAEEKLSSLVGNAEFWPCDPEAPTTSLSPL